MKPKTQADIQEFIRPRSYKAVEAFGFKPGLYRVVRLGMSAEDGRGVVWGVEYEGVIVGSLYHTRDDAKQWAVMHAMCLLFSLRADSHDQRFEWGVKKGLTMNQKTRKALRCGMALTRIAANKYQRKI